MSWRKRLYELERGQGLMQYAFVPCLYMTLIIAAVVCSGTWIASSDVRIAFLAALCATVITPFVLVVMYLVLAGLSDTVQRFRRKSRRT